ncbi:MAG: alcohol dehydrogenase catalytic domain-containing protein [Deltaproteobacteria bacterium]|nr:alcohol dehydrogenase catalytic domain-containing protein [Deltaproteobacteria bacterium]
MKVALCKGIGLLEVTDIPPPNIGDGEVLIRVMAASLCGTDLRILDFGHRKIPAGAGRILGHEFSGVIEKVGPGVQGLSAGERVAVAPNMGCGACAECLQGAANLCPEYEALGISLDGAFAELIRLPAKAVLQGNMVKIPGTVSFEEAALNEPFSCVLNGLEACQIQYGDALLIFGAGPIGLMHLMLGRSSGTRKVILTDIVEERLRLAAELGADVVLHSQASDFKKKVLAETDGKGPDVIVTACPVPEVQEWALEMAAVKGRINFFGGLPQNRETIQCRSNLIHYKNLKVTGVTGSSNIQFRRALSLVASKRVDLHRLISHIFEIEQAKEAFEVARRGAGLKVVIKPNPSRR